MRLFETDDILYDKMSMMSYEQKRCQIPRQRFSLIGFQKPLQLCDGFLFQKKSMTHNNSALA